MITRRLMLCIVFLGIAGTLAAEPDAGVEAAARRLYARYAAGDVDGAMALWSPSASGRDAFRVRLAGILRVRCVEVRDVAVTRVDVHGGRASADVTVSLVKWGRRTSFRGEETERATLSFERGDDGAWRLTAWTRQEEALADAVAAAKSDADRTRLLAARPELVDATLCELLERRALQLVNQERVAEAAVLARLIESIAAERADLAGLAAARGIDSIVLRRQAQWSLEASVQAAREAVLFARASGQPDALSRALLRLGRIVRWHGPDSDWSTVYASALELVDDVESAGAVAMAAGGVSEYQHDVRRDYRAALHYALLSAALAEACGDRVAQLTAQLHIAGAYELDGDYAMAVAHFERVLALARAADVTGSVRAEALFELAYCQLRLGNDDAFLRTMNEGMAARGDARPETTAVGHTFLANYYTSHGRLRLAAREAEAAVRLARTGFREEVRDNALMALAGLRLAQGRPAEALTIVRAMPPVPAALYVASIADRRLGRRGDAYRELRAAIDNPLDRSEADFATDERQNDARFRRRVAIFVDLAGMLIEDRRYDEALQVAEKAKARVLLDVLRGGRGLVRSMMTEQERKHERELEERLARLNAKQGGAPAAGAALAETRRELEEYETILYAKYPRLKAQQGAVPVVTRAGLAKLLDDRSAFLELVVGDDRTSVFLVRRSGGKVSVRCRTIRISRQALASKVERFVGAVAARDRLYAAAARDLGRLLVAPFGSELRGVETLCIIPDGPLWRLPFETLLMPDGRFLVERTAIFYAPSIAVYSEMVRRDRAAHAPGAFLAFADPPVPLRRGSVSETKLRDSEYAPLPEAAHEVEAIARLFGAAPKKVYVGAEAQEGRAKEESPHYAVIHFATHGVLDDRDPMFSHLVLAPRPGDPSEDGLLETWEMMQLDLHANLAVLSACDTARGAIHEGEGLIGMSWALSVAGTSSTIVTQWKIASSTTAALMVDFYRHWLGECAHHPFAKAQALRRARLKVLADPAHRHPFFWSPFVLIGSGS